MPYVFPKPAESVALLTEVSVEKELEPTGSKYQDLRILVPKTIPLMVFRTRVIKYWVLGPAGRGIAH